MRASACRDGVRAEIPRQHRGAPLEHRVGARQIQRAVDDDAPGRGHSKHAPAGQASPQMQGVAAGKVEGAVIRQIVCRHRAIHLQMIGHVHADAVVQREGLARGDVAVVGFVLVTPVLGVLNPLLQIILIPLFPALHLAEHLGGGGLTAQHTAGGVAAYSLMRLLSSRLSQT